MLQTRVIPVLLLEGKRVVKTIKFKNSKYIGDPINIIKIFNDKEVDELIILDIESSKKKKEPNYLFLKELASECFMPVCYGGGINNIEQIGKIFELGIEKVSLNHSILKNKQLIKEASKIFGSQSIIVTIDVKKDIFGNYKIYDHTNKKTINQNISNYLEEIQLNGVGEIMINSVDQDGKQNGYDINLIKLFMSEIRTPLIACGGAGKIEDMKYAKENTSVSALAAGSMFIFHGKHNAVLVSYPKYKILREIFGENK